MSVGNGSTNARIRVVHVITDLATGGAETMLHKIVSRMDRERFESIVVSLRGRGTIGPRIEEAGVPVHAMHMQGVLAPVAAARLVRTVRSMRPTIVQGWMPHGNLFAAISRAASPRARILWNVRQTIDDLRLEKAGTALVIRGAAALAGGVERILYNSRTGAAQHEAIGYPSAKTVILPNGFDCERFRPSPSRRAEVRRELGLDDEAVVIGMIGRSHPMKGHDTFFSAAGALAARRPDVRFVLAGRGVSAEDPAFARMVHEQGLHGRIFLLGERADTERIHAATDIATLSSSWGEGFPNVVGEAMACGVPCVVTRVGDAAWIVGDTGTAVPPADPEALLAGWEALVDAGTEGRGRLGERARRRVVDNFELGRVAGQYEAVYESSTVVETVPVPARTPAAGRGGPPPGVRPAMPGFGALVISLDFELHWGVRDLEAPDGPYRTNLLGAREAIPRILALFEEFGVHATWATVGMLFAKDREALRRHTPGLKPLYDDRRLCPYDEPIGGGETDDPLHFASSLIDRIRGTPGQEVGSHTFSHYYCLERGQTPDAFRADLEAAVAIAAARGIALRSLVFPRNQVNPAYVPLLRDAGIECFRGNQRGRFHGALRIADERRWMRAARFPGAYFGIRPVSTTPWDDIQRRGGVVSIPANAFLRPFTRRLPVLETLQLRRLRSGLVRAARRREVFHLWWHPHNFGAETDRNLTALRRLLETYSRLSRDHGFRSLTMHEASRLSPAVRPRSPGSAPTQMLRNG
jgi:glycosyltransferase involved in cell wall biosynthesis/peptidoglycan/xylan/chitin deacetylase (PgdA/CDA1 family)